MIPTAHMVAVRMQFAFFFMSQGSAFILLYVLWSVGRVHVCHIFVFHPRCLQHSASACV